MTYTVKLVAIQINIVAYLKKNVYKKCKLQNIHTYTTPLSSINKERTFVICRRAERQLSRGREADPLRGIFQSVSGAQSSMAKEEGLFPLLF